MKTMWLCTVCFVLLQIVVGVTHLTTPIADILIFAGAAVWACLMWAEGYENPISNTTHRQLDDSTSDEESSE